MVSIADLINFYFYGFSYNVFEGVSVLLSAMLRHNKLILAMNIKQEIN